MLYEILPSIHKNPQELKLRTNTNFYTMNKLLIFTFFNLLFYSSLAQVWTQKQSITGGGSNSRMASTSFSNNNTKAFVLGGLNGNTVLDDFWQYDEVNDTWLQKPNYPGGEKYGHVSFVIDSIAYVGFGGSQTVVLDQKFWAYNMNTEVWSPIADFPGDGRVYPSTMTINAKGYVGGGVKFISGNAIYLQDFWEYDPVMNTWAQKANYPTGIRVGMISFGQGNKGYMGYGESPGLFIIGFHEYNPANDSWTNLAPPPSSPVSFGSVVTLNNKAYVIGGEFQHNQFTTNVLEYRADSNLWKPISSFPAPPRRNAIAFVLGNNIYYGTGQTGADETNVTDDLWQLGNLSTSVSDELFTSEMTVFPNPFQNNLVVKSPHKIKALEIYNIQGRMVYATSNLTKNEINLSFLNSGMYILKVEIITGERFEEKVLKH